MENQATMALSSVSELEVSCNFLEFPLRFPPTSFSLQLEQKLIAQDLSPPSPSHATCASPPHTLSGKIKFCLCSWEMSSFAQTCACPVPTQAAMLGKAPGWSTWLRLVLHHFSSCQVWTLWLVWRSHWPQVFAINKMPFMKQFQPG